MARTFKTLCDYADWSEINMVKPNKETPTVITLSEEKNIPKTTETEKHNNLDLHYNIQIHLPETTNMAVYDAIFQSLKKHLL